jgi:hypothetical protein
MAPPLLALTTDVADLLGSCPSSYTSREGTDLGAMEYNTLLLLLGVEPRPFST